MMAQTQSENIIDSRNQHQDEGYSINKYNFEDEKQQEPRNKPSNQRHKSPEVPTRPKSTPRPKTPGLHTNQ